jgi:hypothetical protein
MADEPFKIVTIEYAEELVLDSEPLYPRPQRRIKVKTTTSEYSSGGSRGEPNVSVTYEYL